MFLKGLFETPMFPCAKLIYFLQGGGPIPRSRPPHFIHIAKELLSHLVHPLVNFVLVVILALILEVADKRLCFLIGHLAAMFSTAACKAANKRLLLPHEPR